MCGSSGGGQLKPLTTSTTTADPRAQAMYQQAFGTAEQASQTPFQRYSTDPRAFVAQLTPTQQQAISNIAQSQGVYQPYYGAAAGLAGSAGQTSTADVVGQYMSPYMRQVVDPVRAALEQQQGMQLSQQQAEAIKGGAFGGERAGLQRAALRGQQQLGMGQALSPLYQTGYGQALGAAQGDLSRQLQAGQLFGQLGTGAQAAALQGAQGLLGAGTLQQQTEQAGKQALYNQYLMERGYPFQTSQFLTSAAAGLGPLYGGTTTEQQAVNPFGMFLSDPRAKTGVDREEPDVVGKLNDGQNVYAYKYAAGGPAQIGLMADEVAQRYPEAVGQRPDGLMTVDYGKATEVPAAMSSGLGAARMGGAVTDGGDYARGGYASGGDIDEIIARHKAALAAGVPIKMDIPTGAVQASQGLQPAKMSSGQQQQSEGLAGLLGKGAALGKTAESLYRTYDFFKNPEAAMAREAASKHAYGGVPTSLDIPTDPIRASRGLEPARISSGSGEEEDDGILGGLGKAADIGSKLAGIGTFAMKAAPFVMSLSDPRAKTGVRPAFQEGGYSERDLDYLTRTLVREAGGEGERGMEAVGDVARNRLMSGRYGKTFEDVVTAPKQFSPWNVEARGTKADPRLVDPSSDIYRQARAIAERVAGGSEDVTGGATHFYAPKLADPKWARGVEPTAEIGGHRFLKADAGARPLAYTAMDRSAGEGGLGAINRVADRGSLRADAGEAPSAAAPPPAGLGAAKPAEEPGFMDKYAREEYIVPGLVGLAGAVEGALSAPTTSLGAALARGAATGVGAGAKAYEDIQTALPSREKIRAETGETKARGLQENVAAMKAARELPIWADPMTGQRLIVTESGNVMDLQEYLKNPVPVMGLSTAAKIAQDIGLVSTEGPSASPPASSQPTQPPIVPTPKPIAYSGVNIGDAAKNAPDQERSLVGAIGGREALESSRDIKTRINQQGSAARSQSLYNGQVAQIIAEAAAAKGFEAMGSMPEERARIIGGLNTIARGAGLGDNFFGANDSRKQMLEKLNAIRGEATVMGGGQKALGSLELVIGAMPGTGQTVRSGTFNAASNLVQNQRLIDYQNYANAYGQRTSNLYNGVEDAFDSDNSRDRYAREEAAFEQIMQKPTGAKMLSYFLEGKKPDGSKATKEDIDKFFMNNFELPGMSRYFMGARRG